MILRKSSDDLAAMAAAGQVVARALEEVVAAVRPGMSTSALDELAERVVRGQGATPSFKGYRGFPATLCTSVDDQIVHGIPSRDVVLRDGQLLSIDCGAIVDGFHGDSAVTVVVGGDTEAPPEVRALVATTRDALWAGLAAAVVGMRLGDLGAAIEAHATPQGYGVVREYVGHGIGRALHEDPSVPNYGRPGRGLRIAGGWVLAIEPMFVLGRPETAKLADGWTVVSPFGHLSAHWEHTVAVTPDGPRVLTARHDDAAFLEAVDLLAG